MARPLLYDRIDKRVDQMMEYRFFDEVKELLARGYSCNLKSMQSIGYRHLCDFLNQGVPWDETIRLLKRDTRRYAKRQLTWFRNEKDLVWIQPDDIKKAEEMVSGFLSTM